MNTSIKTLTILSLSMASMAALANSENQFKFDEPDGFGKPVMQAEEYKDYLTLNIGLANLASGIKAKGVGIKYGARLSENFGMVTSVAFLQGNDGAKFGTNKLNSNFSGITASVGPSWYITDDFSVYTTVGLMKYTDKTNSHTNSRNKVIGTISNPSGADINIYTWDDEDRKSVSDTTMIYGVGLNYHFFDNLVVNASYETFNGKFSILRKSKSYNAKVFSIGVGFQF